MSGEIPPPGEPPTRPSSQPPSQPAIQPGRGSAHQAAYSPPAPAAPSPPPWWTQPPKRRSLAGRIMWGFGAMIFLLSILLNVYLLMILAVQMEAKFDQSVIRAGDERQVVAVYNVSGMINDKAAANFNRFRRETIDDENVKAVVLRVNSPGGTVGASDQIHSMVAELRQNGKKVVVSMGDVAASGGYYISAGADEIVAEPTTMTGSIGVIAQWFVLEKTLEKIGMDVMILRSSNARGWKDAISLITPPQDRQRKYLQGMLDEMQERFEQVVRDGRGQKLPADALAGEMKEVEGEVTVNQAGKEEEILQEPHDPFNGKAYLAGRAKELGLIDEIGYQDEAVQRAVRLAGLTKPHVVHYKVRRGLLERMMGETGLSTHLEVNRELLDEMQTPRIMLVWKAE